MSQLVKSIVRNDNRVFFNKSNQKSKSVNFIQLIWPVEILHESYAFSYLLFELYLINWPASRQIFEPKNNETRALGKWKNNSEKDLQRRIRTGRKSVKMSQFARKLGFSRNAYTKFEGRL